MNLYSRYLTKVAARFTLPAAGKKPDAQPINSTHSNLRQNLGDNSFMRLHNHYLRKLAAKSLISMTQALDNRGDDYHTFGKSTSAKHSAFSEANRDRRAVRIVNAISRIAKSARPVDGKQVGYSRRYKRYTIEAHPNERDVAGRVAPVLMLAHQRDNVTPDYIQSVAAKHGRTVSSEHAANLAHIVSRHKAENKAKRALNRKLLIGGGALAAAAAAGYGIHRLLKKRREAAQRKRQEAEQQRHTHEPIQALSN